MRGSARGDYPEAPRGKRKQNRNKSFGGAASHVKVAKVANINDTIRRLKEQNIRVLAAETGGRIFTKRT